MKHREELTTTVNMWNNSSTFNGEYNSVENVSKALCEKIMCFAKLHDVQPDVDHYGPVSFIVSDNLLDHSGDLSSVTVLKTEDVGEWIMDWCRDNVQIIQSWADDECYESKFDDEEAEAVFKAWIGDSNEFHVAMFREDDEGTRVYQFFIANYMGWEAGVQDDDIFTAKPSKDGTVWCTVRPWIKSNLAKEEVE